MAITETRFKDRLKGKHKLIDFSIEEKRDYENLQRIMKVLAEQGALIGSAIRQKLCCKQYHPGNPNQKSMSSKRFFQYLAWLKNNGYIFKKSRKGRYELTQEGLDSWGARSFEEIAHSSENITEIILKITKEAIQNDRKQRLLESMAAIQAYRQKTKEQIVAIKEQMVNDAKSLLAGLPSDIDVIYRDKVGKLGFKVIGDWESLEKDN